MLKPAFSGVNGRRRGCPVLAGASRRRHHYRLQFDSRERWKNPSLHICSNAHEYTIETIGDLIERVGRIRFVETSRGRLSHRPQVAETALNDEDFGRTTSYGYLGCARPYCLR